MSNYGTRRIGSNYNLPRSSDTKLLVNIRLATDSEPIAKDITKGAVGRFSNTVKAQLPTPTSTQSSQPSTSETPRNIEVVLTPVGIAKPSAEAFDYVCQWMEYNAPIDQPFPFYDAARQIENDVTFAVHVQAVLLTIDLSLGVLTRKLAGMIAEVIHARPPRVAELEAIWTLLPRSYKLIDAAVESLVKAHRSSSIADQAWKEIEDFVDCDAELKTNFEMEEALQEVRDRRSRQARGRGRGGRSDRGHQGL